MRGRCGETRRGGFFLFNAGGLGVHILSEEMLGLTGGMSGGKESFRE